MKINPKSATNWAVHLNEVGTRITDKMEQAEQSREEAQMLLDRAIALEEELRKAVRGLWTPEEIQQAQAAEGMPVFRIEQDGHDWTATEQEMREANADHEGILEFLVEAKVGDQISVGGGASTATTIERVH